MSKTSIPTILLIGRTNVGKSTIFNRLSSERKSIVFDRDGVTRDHQEEVISWAGKSFKLIDAGGIPLNKKLPPIEQAVRKHIDYLMQTAGLILFICDGKVGITPDDQKIARLIRASKVPTLLLVNKVDNDEQEVEAAGEFSRLGFDLHMISAIHGRGFGTLLEHLESRLEPQEQTSKNTAEKYDYKVALIGKPNVGKSSILNQLLKEERSIVCDEAGTTRDTVSGTLKLHHQSIELTDTAGVRRSRSIEDPLEGLMVKGSLHALKESDIVILIVDASEGSISSQELKLLFYAHEHHKAIILVFNKDDLVDDYTRERFLYDLENYEHLTRKIPTLWTSCLNGKHISRLRQTLNTIWERCQTEINSHDVNEIVQTALARVPMYHNKMPIKIFKVRSIRAKIPTFVLHVNHPSWIRPDHTNFIEKVIRKNYDLRGCPIKFMLRST